mmetsp:Transcript_14669/g.29918  ORF Transcript_14669/g.29918 Transcript_14669/m.29918 type:complete len:99 (+) Transcript_14669:1140-1436(+)
MPAGMEKAEPEEADVEDCLDADESDEKEKAESGDEGGAGGSVTGSVTGPGSTGLESDVPNCLLSRAICSSKERDSEFEGSSSPPSVGVDPRECRRSAP